MPKNDFYPLKLQEYISKLNFWSNHWHFLFGLSKNVLLSFKRKCFTSCNIGNFQISCVNTDLGITLSSISLLWIHFICCMQAFISGVTLDDHLSWSTQITNIINKATKMLNFIKRHLSMCSADTKATAWLLMVRPVMEYACVLWDLHYQTQFKYQC